jgi:glutathione S-transferase
MKVFDHPVSPYAFKVRVTLYEKGLEFEKHEILRRSQREELLRVNPRGEVPALQDGDALVYDSTVICEYIEEKYPSPRLLPADAAVRARCRVLEAISDTQIDALVFVIALFKLFRPNLQSDFPDLSSRAGEILEKHYANLDKELAGREYFVGEFSRADIAICPHLGATAFMGYPVSESYPNLAQWVARMNERPSIQRASQEAMTAFGQSQTDPDSFADPRRLHWRSDRIEWAARLGLGRWLLDEFTADRAFFSPVP